MYKLLIEDDEGGKTAVSLIRDEITIGRKEGNTIRLTDRNVSRRHGRIVRDDDRIYVEDVAARYGIKKNGKKIDDRTEIEEGDVVLIGDYRLTLQGETKGKKKKDKKEAKGADKKPPKLPKSDDFDGDRSEPTQIIQTMPAKLVVISSNFAGEEFPLVENEMVIGRGDACNIIIDHRSISGKHAKIVREDNTTYKIVDLNSKNGVKVSGDTYRATLLQRGDVVELGHVKFRFVEPGENYVFTPQSVDDSAPSPAPIGGGSSGLDVKTVGGILAGVVALMLLLGVVVVFGGDEDEEEAVADEVAEVTDEDQERAIQEIEELEEEGEEGRVDVAIARAEEGIAAGQLRQPATRLETIRDMMDPSADQEERISSLERKIQNMQPFKPNYEDTVRAAERGEYVAALSEADQIPGHLALRNRLEDEGVMDEIFNGILEIAHDELEQENLDESRELANEILLVDSDYAPAQQMLEAVNEKESELEEAIAAREAERQAAPTPVGPSDSSSDSSSSPSPSPSPSSDTSSGSSAPSAAEAQDMYIQAARKVTGGSPQDAISICTEALRAGHTDCHRILGLAYGRLDDTANACNHFQQYLATNPGNPAAVEAQMENYGC